MSDIQVEEALILREDNAGVATLRLNRPKQFNSLSTAVLTEIQNNLTEIANDESIRVVVIAAEGRAFCAGHDLKEMRSNCDETFYNDLFTQCGQMMMTINTMPQPVIAKIQGIATAAGCQLVAACDLAVTVDTAKFATSGINVGLFCSTPAVALSRNVPRKQAMELLLTGEFMDAETAKQYGLVNRIATVDTLDEEVDKLVATIMHKSSVAIATGKRMFYKQLEMNMDDAYQYASQVMACNMMAEDAAEGIDAFMQKRAPEWKGK